MDDRLEERYRDLEGRCRDRFEGAVIVLKGSTVIVLKDGTVILKVGAVIVLKVGAVIVLKGGTVIVLTLSPQFIVRLN
jgi:hypothetical protein